MRSKGSPERLNVLVVNRESITSELLETMLSLSGHSSIIRQESFEVLRYINENPNRVDAVISDLGIIGMTGLDLAHQLRNLTRARNLQDIAFLLTTTQIREDELYSRMEPAKSIREAIEKGEVDAFLGMPFHILSLTEKIGQARANALRRRPR